MHVKYIVYMVILMIFNISSASARLNTSEANKDINREIRIERGEERINKLRSKAVRDGYTSPNESSRIQRLEMEQSKHKLSDKHNN